MPRSPADWRLLVYAVRARPLNTPSPRMASVNPPLLLASRRRLEPTSRPSRASTAVTLGRASTSAASRSTPAASVEGFTSGLNVLYVPERKLFGGSIGLAITIPVGHLNGDATIGVAGGPSVATETEGWGFGDVTTRAQLGWKE